MAWPKSAHGNTYGGNPLAACPLATMDLIENGMMVNAASVGEYALRRLKALMEQYDCTARCVAKG